MGLVDLFSVVAATAGALVGAVEGIIHLGGEVSKISSQQLYNLLFGQQHIVVSSVGDAVASARKLSLQTAKKPRPSPLVNRQGR
jgi:hypothetical protein